MRKILTAGLAALTLGGAVAATSVPADAAPWHGGGGGYHGGGYHGGGGWHGGGYRGGGAGWPWAARSSRDSGGGPGRAASPSVCTDPDRRLGLRPVETV